jgi:phosphoribosylformimino-5-aminoimidazole carboxamide ribotide isomerase
MMRIIPAIDIIDGKCVRLSQGDYNQKRVYNENPLEVAKQFQDAGLTHLHLVDLDGAKAGKIINWKVLEKITSATNLTVDVGGGVKTEEDLKVVLNCGAKQVNIGSLAVSEPQIVLNWLAQYSADVIILSADVKGTKVAVSGWLKDSGVELNDLISQFTNEGLRYAVCTDISKDGMLQGPSFDLYKQLLTDFPKLRLIASGGVAEMDDLYALREIGVNGVIVGKAIYEGRIRLNELSRMIVEIN